MFTFPIQAASGDPLPNVICFMPAGIHLLNAHTIGGSGFAGQVVCDSETAKVLQASFAQLKAIGQRPYIDLDHDDGAAAAWIKGFYWDERGVMALVEWTSLGEEALRGRQYFSFSPTFLCDSLTGKVNGLVSNHAAGALTNSPAFQNAMPALVAASLWEPGGIDRALAEISIQIQTIKRKMTS